MEWDIWKNHRQFQSRKLCQKENTSAKKFKFEFFFSGLVLGEVPGGAAAFPKISKTPLLLTTIKSLENVMLASAQYRQHPNPLEGMQNIIHNISLGERKHIFAIEFKFIS